MGADKFNGSGCFDETVYKVMRREKRKKRLSLVYICSRYAGDVEKNVDAAKKYCRFVLNQNVVPLAPHLLYPCFMDDSKEQDLVRTINKVLLGRCDQVWVFGETISSGMGYELKLARNFKKPIKYFGEGVFTNA